MTDFADWFANEAETPEMPDWQRRLAQHILDGGTLDLTTAAIAQRNTAKRAMTIAWCATQEAARAKWDVIGPDAARIRREARELAARLTSR